KRFFGHDDASPSLWLCPPPRSDDPERGFYVLYPISPLTQRPQPAAAVRPASHVIARATSQPFAKNICGCELLSATQNPTACGGRWWAGRTCDGRLDLADRVLILVGKPKENLTSPARASGSLGVCPSTRILQQFRGRPIGES